MIVVTEWPEHQNTAGDQFLRTLFLEHTTEMGGNKCKAVFYTYKQIGMQRLELLWPCLILAKNLGDILAHGLSIHSNMRSVSARTYGANYFQQLTLESWHTN